MPKPEYLEDYHDFMIWFEMKYPDLYERYKENIAPATDESGLRVLQHNISPAIYNKIFDIENEYYISTR